MRIIRLEELLKQIETLLKALSDKPLESNTLTVEPLVLDYLKNFKF